MINQWAVPVREVERGSTKTYPKPFILDLFLQPTAGGYSETIVPTGKRWRIMAGQINHTLGAVDFFTCCNSKFQAGGFAQGGITFFVWQIVDLNVATQYLPVDFSKNNTPIELFAGDAIQFNSTDLNTICQLRVIEEDW